MFTGLVEDVGEVLSRENRAGLVRLTVATHLPTHELHLGDSVAVDGACFTVVDINGSRFSVEIGPESLTRTVAGSYSPGTPVNLERALQAGARLGGHFVLGHVDGVGTLRSKRRRGDAWDFAITADPHVLDLTPPKGSIAIDGISLTVNNVVNDVLEVSIIPHTQLKTTLMHKEPGAAVNLETDMLARTVAWLLQRRGVLPAREQGVAGSGGITMDMLKQAGFM